MAETKWAAIGFALAAFSLLYAGIVPLAGEFLLAIVALAQSLGLLLLAAGTHAEGEGSGGSATAVGALASGLAGIAFFSTSFSDAGLARVAGGMCFAGGALLASAGLVGGWAPAALGRPAGIGLRAASGVLSVGWLLWMVFDLTYGGTAWLPANSAAAVGFALAAATYPLPPPAPKEPAATKEASEEPVAAPPP